LSANTIFVDRHDRKLRISIDFSMGSAGSQLPRDGVFRVIASEFVGWALYRLLMAPEDRCRCRRNLTTEERQRRRQ
jgi:hypothetical protein